MNNLIYLQRHLYCVVPGSKGLQLVVSEVQHPEAAVSRQQRDAFVCQAVIGHIQLLQAAAGII